LTWIIPIVGERTRAEEVSGEDGADEEREENKWK
jgi:hypothetical protein